MLLTGGSKTDMFWPIDDCTRCLKNVTIWAKEHHLPNKQWWMHHGC